MQGSGDALDRTAVEAMSALVRDIPEQTRLLQAIVADSGTGVLQRVVELARQQVGMDVAYIAHFDAGRRVTTAFAGRTDEFGLVLGDGPPLAMTYCSRMILGELPHVIPDTAADNRVRYLPTTAANRIGAYIGVPLRLSDGSLYGTFCCMSHRAEPDLTARDVDYLQLLAGLLTEELDREQERLETHALITEVLNRGRIRIAVQPVLRLNDRSRLGVEALARFPAEFGTPETLFPAARAVGLGIELEQLTAARAMELAPTLGSHEFLSINMSPDSIIAWESLVDGFSSVSANRLVLEVTEHHAIDRYDDVRRSVQSLRHRGIRMAIDDVGAGYASLHHVLQLEPDFIKIDRKLVHGCATDRARRSVIRGFVALAADLGAQVIGEGVERPDDLQALMDLGVDAAQGYLLGRPTIEHPTAGRGHSWTDDDPLPAPRRA